MSKKITISIACVALLGTLAGCTGSTGAVADNNPGRMVCRTEPNTGSRLPKRVCKTALEWEQIAAKNLEERRNLSRATTEGNAPSESGRVQ